MRNFRCRFVFLTIIAALCVTLAGPSGLSAAEKVAIIHVYTSDAHQDTKWDLSKLKTHFNGPIRDFWTELSHGAYSPEFSFFEYPLLKTRAQLKAAGEHFVVDAIKKLVPDLKISGYVPSDYSMTHILLSGSDYGFGGGMGPKTLKVNGVEYKIPNLGSFTYHYEPKKFLRFYSTPAGKPFRGKQAGTTSRYPELRLLDEDGALLHEWGHGLGLSVHANGWYSVTEPMYGAIYYWKKKDFWGQDGDYGNWFDIMGRGEYSLHFNAFYQDLLGWLQADERRDVTSTTRGIRLNPLEVNQDSDTRAIYIPIAAGALNRPSPFDTKLDYAFYVEYRQAYGFDKHLGHPDMVSNTQGLMVTLTRRQGSSFINSWLLDMSPDGIEYKNKLVVNKDHVIESGSYVPFFQETTLNRGKTFYDEQTKVMLTNVRANGMSGVTFDVIREPVRGVASGVYTTALRDGKKLPAGERLYSPELTHYAVLQPADGNFVVYRSEGDRFVWGSYNNADVPLGGGSQHLEVVDGNVRLVRGGAALWETKTGGHSGAELMISESGDVLVVDARGSTVWSSARDGVQPTTGTGPLQEGKTLAANERLYSPDRSHYLILQFDGNLVLYQSRGDRFVWGSYNNADAPLGGGSQHLEVVDGNVRLVRKGVVVWETKTGGHSGANLVVANDGGLSVQAADGSVLWRR